MAATASIAEASAAGKTPARQETVAKPDNIERTVKAILKDYLFVEDKYLVNKNTLRADLGADEMDITEIVMAIEKQYKITITDAELEIIINGTIDNLIKTVRKKIAAK